MSSEVRGLLNSSKAEDIEKLMHMRMDVPEFTMQLCPRGCSPGCKKMFAQALAEESRPLSEAFALTLAAESQERERKLARRAKQSLARAMKASSDDTPKQPDELAGSQ